MSVCLHVGFLGGLQVGVCVRAPVCVCVCVCVGHRKGEIPTLQQCSWKEEEACSSALFK